MDLGQLCYVKYVRNKDRKNSRSAGNIKYAGPGQLLTCSCATRSLKISVTRLALGLQRPVEVEGTGRPAPVLAATVWNGCDKLLLCLVLKQTQAGFGDYVLRLQKPNWAPDTKKMHPRLWRTKPYSRQPKSPEKAAFSLGTQDLQPLSSCRRRFRV